MPERKPYRLPTNVVPERYEIKLTPDLSAAIFAGEEKIDVQIIEPVRKSLSTRPNLHSKPFPSKGPAVKWCGEMWLWTVENEQATFDFPETLNPGRWELQIAFSGILNDKLHGFYRSTYKDSNGREKTWLRRSSNRPTRGGLSLVGMSRRLKRSSRLHW